VRTNPGLFRSDRSANRTSLLNVSNQDIEASRPA
jgi:hypothetical protein